MKRRVLVWFRQDLRLHDNEALSDAVAVADEVIPVFVFDERVFEGKTLFGFPKTGHLRHKFIVDSVRALRESLAQAGVTLVVRTGISEDILFDLARQLKTSWIFCNRERTSEEVRIQDTLEQRLWSIGQEMRYSRGKMLYYTADLPYPVTHTPDSFRTFVKETERIVPIRDPIEVPRIPGYPENLVEPGEIPRHTSDTGLKSDFIATGGEGAGLDRLSRLIKSSQEDAESMNGLNLQPSLSPWLAQGCLSAKYIYHVLKPLIEEGNEQVLELYRGLLVRDFHRLMVKKHGSALFARTGLVGTESGGPEVISGEFRAWQQGMTGEPLVDAAMRHLEHTGFMPHVLRKVVARFLIDNCGVSWRLGASYFESQLIDYDPCSNWSNWCDLAGVGVESSDHRPLNYQKLSHVLDPDGKYVDFWTNPVPG